MCLALPGRIVATRGLEAEVVVGAGVGDGVGAGVGDTPRTAGLQLHPQARPGDYVLVKAGLVVEILPEAAAKELMAFFTEMVAALEGTDGTT
jgi:hydrogenase assembly chaperone HypC/HupF